MSSINDMVSSTAASNPFVGGAVASGSVQAGILSTLDQATSTSSNDELTNLIAAANSQAALAPAANFTPSAELTAAMNAASNTFESAVTAPSVQLATAAAGTESTLLEGLGGSLNVIA